MKFLKNIFRKEEPMVPFSLGCLKTDIHSHLIPGIDDGSDSMQTSLNLARGLVELGYTGAVTTPHVMSDYYQNSPEIIKSGLEELNNELVANNIPLKVEAAAEYLVDFDFFEKIEKEKLLTFGDNYILVECSFVDAPMQLSEAIFALQTNGYKPVLAHPERYIYWQAKYDIYNSLKEKGVLFQTNLLSLKGRNGPIAQKTAEWLIMHNMVEWLGSDLHNYIHLRELKHYRVKESIAHKILDCDFLNKTLRL